MWLDDVVKCYKEAETPQRYFWWAGLSALSALVKKNIYLDRYTYLLYPNIYVMIVSKTSGLRKGNAISFAKKIISSIGNCRVIDGQNSIQSVIKELSQQVTFEEGPPQNKAQAFLVSGEFHNLVLDDPNSMTILTELYNTHENPDTWKKNLKSGKETLKEPCITMLGASNERLLNDIINTIDIEGGFLARTHVVYESKRNRVNSLMEKPISLIPFEDLLVRPREVSKLSGQFTLTNEAKAHYDIWYLKTTKLSEEIDDRTGTLDRLGDSVLKVAMLISMSRSNSLVITDEDLSEAIDKCEECFHGTRQLLLTSGTVETSEATAILIKELVSSPDKRISKNKLLSKHWNILNSDILNKVYDTLSDNGAGIVKMIRGNDKKIYYELSQEAYEQYCKFKSEEN